MRWALILACVAGISLGQVLFRKAAMALPAESSWSHWVFNPWLAVALVLYGVTTLGWVWALRNTPLNQAYPLMGLAFLFVPLLEYGLLQQPLHGRVLVGGALILAGVAVASGRPA